MNSQEEEKKEKEEDLFFGEDIQENEFQRDSTFHNYFREIETVNKKL